MRIRTPGLKPVPEICSATGLARSYCCRAPGRCKALHPAGGRDLPLEPSAELGVLGELVAYELERHGTTATRVGEEHGAHTAGTDPGTETVTVDLRRVPWSQRPELGRAAFVMHMAPSCPAESTAASSVK